MPTNAKALTAGAAGALWQPAADFATGLCQWVGAPDTVCEPFGYLFAFGITFLVTWLVPNGLPTPAAPPPRQWNTSGRAELRALAIVASLAGLLLIAVRVFAGPNILTGHVTVTTTPISMGTSAGRGLLSIAVPTAAAGGVDCGPSDLPVATYRQIDPGQAIELGIVYRGQYTAEKPISCLLDSAQATPVDVEIVEEGGMPDRTSTATSTATPTETPTATGTATETPTQTPTPTPT